MTLSHTGLIGKLLTLARTFSNEAGLTSEKQIKNTSYRNKRRKRGGGETLRYEMKLNQRCKICKIISGPFLDSAQPCGTGMKIETEIFGAQTEEAFSFLTRVSSG